MKKHQIIENAVTFLSTGLGWWETGEGERDELNTFSCNAVWDAVHYYAPEGERREMYGEMCRILRSAGVDPDRAGQFEEFTTAPERQQARALWLSWVSLMVKEGEL